MLLRHSIYGIRASCRALMYVKLSAYTENASLQISESSVLCMRFNSAALPAQSALQCAPSRILTLGTQNSPNGVIPVQMIYVIAGTRG